MSIIFICNFDELPYGKCSSRCISAPGIHLCVPEMLGSVGKWGNCGENWCKYLPLHADMRKYPQSVISLKSKLTTGLVCPLSVIEICRILLMVICALFYGKLVKRSENFEFLHKRREKQQNTNWSSRSRRKNDGEAAGPKGVFVAPSAQKLYYFRTVNAIDYFLAGTRENATRATYDVQLASL